MTSIARKNLFADKPKLLASVGGVGLSVLLVLALLSVYFGSIRLVRAVPEHSGADRWVVQKGLTNLFNTFSILPDGRSGALKRASGASAVSAVVNHPSKVTAGDTSKTAAVIGYDPASDFSGPWQVLEGSGDVRPGTVVVDRTLSRLLGIGVGDSLTIGPERFEVIGLSGETNAIEYQYVFVTREDAQRVFDQRDIVNYYLVETDDSAALERAVPRVLPNAETQSVTTVADANERVISDSFLPIILLLVCIGLAVGVTVIGLTIYTATAERAREFAVLKAVGIGNARLYGIVTAQSLIASLAGSVVGLGLFQLVQWIAFHAAPAVYFSLAAEYYGYVLAGVIVMSIVAAFVPIRKLTQIDPVEVFNA